MLKDFLHCGPPQKNFPLHAHRTPDPASAEAGAGEGGGHEEVPPSDANVGLSPLPESLPSAGAGEGDPGGVEEDGVECSV
jgi:hypothetical protein